MQSSQAKSSEVWVVAHSRCAEQVLPGWLELKYTVRMLSQKRVRLASCLRWLCRGLLGRLALWSGATNPNTKASRLAGLGPITHKSKDTCTHTQRSNVGPIQNVNIEGRLDREKLHCKQFIRRMWKQKRTSCQRSSLLSPVCERGDSGTPWHHCRSEGVQWRGRKKFNYIKTGYLALSQDTEHTVLSRKADQCVPSPPPLWLCVEETLLWSAGYGRGLCWHGD